MKQSLRPFLQDIIDYAGLYPPASLSLKDAFSQYLEHRQSEESWMLSSFVLGAQKLNELAPILNESSSLKTPVSLSIVGAATSDLGEFKTTISDTVKEIASLYKKAPSKIRATALEVKLPVDALYSETQLELIQAIDYVVKIMSKSPALPHRVYFEIPGFDFDAKLAEKVIKVIAAHNIKIQEQELPHYIFSGFKIRCGGVEAYQFPRSSYLAKVIMDARDQNLPVKFTAGLHHPIRHFNESVDTKMHGFINVFGGSILSYTQDLSEKELMDILNEEDPKAFRFTDSYFSWRDLAAPNLEVKMLRMLAVISYGSCSFEEPIEDLKALKLI